MSFYYKWQNKREVHLKYVYIQRDDPVFVTGSCRGLFIFLCGSVNQNSIKILKTEKRNPFHFFVCKQWRRHRERVRNGGMRFEVYINWTLYSISYGFWPPNSNKYGTQLYNSTSSFTASASQSSTNGIILHWEISLGLKTPLIDGDLIDLNGSKSTQLTLAGHLSKRSWTKCIEWPLKRRK